MSHIPDDRINHDAVWQVTYLKDEKGLSFELVSEAEAIDFLQDMTFFFKIKSFAKNYEKRIAEGPNQGKYINLDFGHLVELSRLDAHVRSVALSLSLDIEHYLKVRINKAAMANKTNPCALTENFLNYTSQVINTDIIQSCDLETARKAICEAKQTLELASGSQSIAEIISDTNAAIDALEMITGGRQPNYAYKYIAERGASPYSRDLAKKYASKSMPYWAFMELISFGTLIKLYKFCFKKHGYISDEAESAVAKRAMNLLRNTQNLRNAAAHGDCLLSGLNRRSKSASRSGVKRAIIKYGLSADVVSPVGSMSLAMDMAALLLCYDMVVSSTRSKEAAANKLAALSKRLMRNRAWFSKNQTISSFIDYAESLFGLFISHWS